MSFCPDDGYQLTTAGVCRVCELLEQRRQRIAALPPWRRALHRARTAYHGWRR